MGSLQLMSCDAYEKQGYQECRRILRTRAFASPEDKRAFCLFMDWAARQPKWATLRVVSPAPAMRSMSRNLLDTAAASMTSGIQPGKIGTRRWRTSTALCATRVTRSSREGCRWAQFLPSTMPRSIHTTYRGSPSTLYAPSLWLDGWGVPWYSSFFGVITQKWLADYFHFAERDPWGIKDPRIRALVEEAIVSGNSSQAGIAALPGSLMLELRWLV